MRSERDLEQQVIAAEEEAAAEEAAAVAAGTPPMADAAADVRTDLPHSGVQHLSSLHGLLASVARIAGLLSWTLKWCARLCTAMQRWKQPHDCDWGLLL